MSGVGFWELILVFLIGLIVLGPERLPRVASQLGTWLGQARRMTRVMKRQLEDELNLEKETGIRPRPSALPPPSQVLPGERKNDAFSPPPAADAAGTDVGETSVRDDNGDAAAKGGDQSGGQPGASPAQDKTT
jgi:Tat protein translocase TatB subunit